jgi:uncharacterized low-complexity protein
MTEPPKRKRRKAKSRSGTRPTTGSWGGKASSPGEGDPSRRKWPNPIPIVISIGAIAGAILSIAGVIALVTPDDAPSPRGNFEAVTADTGQGLTEFAVRQTNASLDGANPTSQQAAASARPVQFAQVALSPAAPAAEEQTAEGQAAEGQAAEGQAAEGQATEGQATEGQATEGQATEGQATEGQTTEGQTTDEQTTDEQTTDEQTTDEQTTDEETTDGETTVERTETALREQLPENELPDSWEYKRLDGRAVMRVRKKDCSASFSSVGGACYPVGDGETGNAVVDARKLLRVIDATRKRPDPETGTSEPVGAAVNFNLTLENLEGRDVVVRWSMYRRGAGSPLPRDYLVNRRGFEANIDSSPKTVSGLFWVPLPPRRGPYFVRVTAWDGDTRLDYEDSKPLIK